MGASDIWITAHHELADAVFSDPIRWRLTRIRERLAGHGYALKLDIGKRSTRATVTSKTLKVRSSYRSLDGFMQFEEDRLARMDEASS